MAFALIIKNKLVLEYGIEMRHWCKSDNVIVIVSTVLVRVIQLMQ